MRIIISPAKKMQEDRENTLPLSQPAFLREARQVKDYLQALTLEQQTRLWGCNDEIAQLNHERLLAMDRETFRSPALLAYQGIQYQYMAPVVFADEELAYISRHLRILSGFYGLLRPLDGVVPYRLEMQAKAQVAGTKNLYAFWGDKLYKALLDESRIVVNLASKEYSKAITPHLTPQDQLITCTFGELAGEKIVQKGVYVKIARGEMVRYLVQAGSDDPEVLQQFHGSGGYQYDAARSTPEEWVFLKK